MAELRHVVTRISGPDTHMTALSDLLALWVGGQYRLYSASGQGGGVLVQRANAGLSLLSGHGYAESPGLDAPRGLLQADLLSGPALLVPGRAGGELTGWHLQADGGLGGRFGLRLGTGGEPPGPVLSLVPVQLGARQAFVTSHRSTARQNEGLHVWEETAPGILTERAAGPDAALLHDNDIFALAAAYVGGQAHVLALSETAPSLTSLQVGADGTLTRMARIDSRDGLFVSGATQLKVADVAGVTYAILGAASSGSVSVVALSAGGGLFVTDQVNDDLNSRFAGLSALATVQMGAQTYVAVAGADDGISLMALLPGGRLLHMATLAEDGAMALRDPAALSLMADGTGLDIFVAGDLAPGTTEAGMGLTHLRAELGAAGRVAVASPAGGDLTGTGARDQLAGSVGDDRLYGAAGDDTLIGGQGADTLTGGAGADVFVLSGDGQMDTIADFQPGVDRMDLSGLGRFYTLEALRISPERGGAVIRLGQESVLVRTADGSRLTPDRLSLGDVRDLWHVSGAPLPPAGQALTGSDGADLLDGRAGADTLWGGAGGDLLQGQDGDDWLSGEDEDSQFDPVSGQIYRLYQATLARTPDPTGLFHWAAMVQSGARPLAGVAQGFVEAPEFQATYGTTGTQAFVTLLYGNVLNRTPDAAGLAHWSALLDSGARSRAEVVVGFSESPEFVATTAAGALSVSRAALQSAAVGDVFRLYQAVLARAPDLAGLQGWTTQLAEGVPLTTVVAGFVGAPEFVQRFGATDANAFVTLLYQNVLGRSPDTAGLAHWTGLLDSGARSRAQVVEAFVQSPEFRAASAGALAAWVRAQGIDDTLDGGAGHNLLFGGLMADRFVFHAGQDAHHIVTDLEPWDSLVFDGFGYAGHDDILAHMAQQGADVLFQDQGVRVTLMGQDLSVLGADDLLLA